MPDVQDSETNTANDDHTNTDTNTDEDSQLTSDTVFQTLFKERTFGDLKKDYERFTEMGGKRSTQGKKVHSTVNKSVLEEDDATLVLQKVPFPELHVMEGVVNHHRASRHGENRYHYVTAEGTPKPFFDTCLEGFTGTARIDALIGPR